MVFLYSNDIKGLFLYPDRKLLRGYGSLAGFQKKNHQATFINHRQVTYICKPFMVLLIVHSCFAAYTALYSNVDSSIGLFGILHIYSLSFDHDHILYWHQFLTDER